MENLQVFTKDEFGTIRTVQLNNETYFVGKDVCEAFGDTNYRRSLANIDDFEKGVSQNDKRIEERIQKLKKFKHWITSEVLPTIRKTGGYVNNDEMFINTYLPFADESTKLLFCQTLKTVREQNAIIQNQKKEIMHKEDVIIGLVEDIDLATKRQRITQIVRRCSNKKYQERYRLLYTEFEKKYHCNLSIRMENNTLKPKARNTMDYIDRGMNMIPQLYEITCKLFENDVEALKAEWESVVV